MVKLVSIALRAVASRLVITDENIDGQRASDKERVERVEVGQRACRLIIIRDRAGGVRIR